MVILEGKAELLNDPAVNTTLPAYAAKYDSLLKSVGLTAEAMAAVYSQALLITPTRFFHRQGKRGDRMPIVTIVYHSNSGHTTKLAEAVETGAASVAGIEVHRLAITGDDIVKGRWENPAIMAQLDASDAIIFGAPTSMGDVSGQMKCFLDATSTHFYPRAWANKLAAGFTCSFYPSGDKLHTLHTFVTFAMQQGMLWIGHNEARFEEVGPKIYEPASINRLGGWIGVMATSHPWSSPESFPNEADLSAGYALGRRVSEATIRWAHKEGAAPRSEAERPSRSRAARELAASAQ
jgi:NAD(P)H dehydrogenase (quinone)